MSHSNSSLVERLFAAGNPRSVQDWEGRDGYYVAACRVSADDVPHLVDIARRWTDLDWQDDVDDDEWDGSEEAQLLPVTAWRTLADLRADAAVEPLVEMLRALDDAMDDWASDDLPRVFGKIGASAIEPLVAVARDRAAAEFIRSIAVRSLRRVVDCHPPTRDRIVPFLVQWMAGAADDDIDFNSILLVELVELHAVEAAESIERAFAGNLLDVGMMGDWEKVRKQLGVQGLGLKMPEDPYNSIDTLRENLGVGIFSDQPIFMLGEIEHDAEQAYYQRAEDTFSKSSEARQVIDRHGDLAWFRMLLEFGINYLGETVDQMTLESVREFLLSHVPRKVAVEPKEAATLVGELAAFWEYLDRVYQLPQAKTIVAWLGTNGLVAQVKARLSDSANFGMGKSFVMAGKRAGYDMTTQADLDAFMTSYNQSLRLADAETLPPSPSPSRATRPIVGKPKIGRNDPCPCGSGKKFKKCCM